MNEAPILSIYFNAPCSMYIICFRFFLHSSSFHCRKNGDNITAHNDSRINDNGPTAWGFYYGNTDAMGRYYGIGFFVANISSNFIVS